MKALTFWQPWLWAMQFSGKRIENRSWSPPEEIRNGEPFALHAGRRWDPEALAYITAVANVESEIPTRSQVPSGAVVGVGRVVEIWRARATEDPCEIAATNVRTGKELDPQSYGQDHWFFGPFGWLLDCEWIAEPVPCRGFQQFWTLPADVERAVRALLASGRAGTEGRG